MTDCDIKYQKYLDIINCEIEKIFSNISISNEVVDIMKYAVEGGGKRVRPVLCLATADMLNVPINDVIKFSLSIEFIHSYSLVHDDLPAMDNDDYRRGKLSTHKKFGEANGILGGDALLNFAFETALDKDNFSQLDSKALKVIADYAGYSGMIYGQFLDLKMENKSIYSVVDLKNVYINKTSKLLTAPLLVSSILSGGKYYKELNEFGFNLGMCFQIVDDFMDYQGDINLIGKTPGKDLDCDKLTSIKVFGLNGAKDKLNEYYNKAKSIITAIPNSQFLAEFTDKLYYRRK